MEIKGELVNNPNLILVIGKKTGEVLAIKEFFEKQNYQVDSSFTAIKSGKIFTEKKYSHVIINEPVNGNILGYANSLKSKAGDTPFLIILDAKEDYLKLDRSLLKEFDFMIKPIRNNELFLRILKHKEEPKPVKPEDAKDYFEEHIIAKNRKMTDIFDVVKKVADYKTTVLVVGESGTGKELIAKAIHHYSPRADGPFVTVNCGAIPENLIESELFGHIKGSFTGAYKDKKGLFEEATNGTIFLDEVGELPLLLQVKLLRALQEEKIRRVGDVRTININVRVISATLKDLVAEVEKGTFREDLFYRLNVLPIYLPPLRERKDDIDLLIDYFVEKFGNKLDKKIDGIDADALDVLYSYNWPGNIRELENTIERACVLTPSKKIQKKELTPQILGNENVIREAEKADLSIKRRTQELEEDLIIRALKKATGNKTKAAKILEISNRALIYKIQKYGLRKKIDKEV